MAEFYAPQINMPDMYGAYLRGKLGAQAIQQGEQTQQENALKMQQLTMALRGTQQQMDMAQSIYQSGQGTQPTQTGQAVGGNSGEIQQGPQASSYTQPPLGASSTGGMITPNPYTLVALEGLKTGDYTKAFTNVFGMQDAQRKDQQQRTKLQLQPAVDQIEAVRTSANPEQLVMANPSYKQVWDQYAPQLGLNPHDPKDMTPENVRMAATLAHNALAGQSMGTIEPLPMPTQLQKVTDNSGYQYLNDPLSGKPTELPNQMTTQQREQLDMERKRLELASRVSEGFSGKAGELLAALTEKGVSLPAGMRSKEQQLATVQGLIDRHPDKSADEIADMVKSGTINITAAKKEAAVAGGIVGRTSVGENELINFAPLALKASAAVPRGQFVPFTKLQQWGLANISDPNLKELYGRTNAILNAYDVVAARGGTDADKRKENRRNLETADSPAAYQRALETMISEAKLAKQSGRQAVAEAAGTGTGADAHPSNIQALLDKYK